MCVPGVPPGSYRLSDILPACPGDERGVLVVGARLTLEEERVGVLLDEMDRLIWEAKRRMRKTRRRSRN